MFRVNFEGILCLLEVQNIAFIILVLYKTKINKTLPYCCSYFSVVSFCQFTYT